LTPPRCRQAIALGLLLPGLLFAHPAVAASARPVPKKASPKSHPRTHPVVERKARTDTRPAVVAGRTVHAVRPGEPRTRPAVAAGRTVHAARSGEPPTKPAAAVGRAVHVVRSGDTLSRIAVRYGVSRKALLDANKLAHPERLRVGQRIMVPRAPMAAPEEPVRLIDAALANGDVLLVRAGPRRVPTRLYMAETGTESLGVELAWPVEGEVISPFGRRHRGWHAGLDIKAEIGSPILAAAAGTVISSGQEPAYGRVIRVEHDGGVVTVYAHNLENLVEVGDHVSPGTIIGTVGRSGRATGPHLHFEIRHDGIVYNPLHLLPPREVIEARPEEAPDMAMHSAGSEPIDGNEDE
jgi:lipoprotein NlpD